MAAVDVIAVVGGCAPERARYARGLADASKQRFVPATHLREADHPAEEAAKIACWCATRFGSVVEFPTEAEPVDVVAAFADPDGAVRLAEIVCVVDAPHLLHDLADESFLARRDGSGGVEQVARALLAAHQIEFASTVVLLNWKLLAAPKIALVTALICHLNPSAQVQLHDGWRSLGARPGAVRVPAHERPGWIRALSDEFQPRITHPEVGVVRYQQVRPLHPARLLSFLDERLGTGEFGTVVRSAGFCRLATRPTRPAEWDQTGSVIALHPLAPDEQVAEEDELLAVGQELVFIGLGLDRRAIARALDEVALDDEELLAGPQAWAELCDPFPAWPGAEDRAD
ncbi:cobalamin synthesis CobW domain protein [Segniliparus rotundus DSM 44985]|uniref:Cobalamin synthesis CobW domain protein n=1 Tax=Segniliparus rotundus (strain ATCC BAA-972 / CDC 1076 / CIP 108378 / DSM 44985 / JCM 13578) TaxID=640132 RepID=D6ZCE8_SEGRD|nr:GTP-binding protein [Segniliparus rotundus]ADG99117.1 cobalamin synthesis CobW domain protein [Segniliparus rotundus DSM 44985]